LNAADRAAKRPSSIDNKAELRPGAFTNGHFTLQKGDVVAFVGGADVAAALESGHLETLLTAKFRGLGVRFRNFGWEGDTVHAQPRDVGFPPLRFHLKRAAATVIVFQFGRCESLSGRAGLSDFVRDYGDLLNESAELTSRLVLVTPPPFEQSGGLLPDLSKRNADVAVYSQAIRNLARERRLPIVDLFGELGGESHREPRLTADGLQLTPHGHALVAAAFVRQLGFVELAAAAGAPDADGIWPNVPLERLRQIVVAENRLWFNYWRPENWAFLGGDRTEQPSSRDYRDPKIRWFPAEMEKFVPMIEAKEREIAKQADELP
jgi:hypothetical protein